MTQLEENVSLAELNSFRLAVKARRFVRVMSDGEVFDAVRCAERLSVPLLVLGGGSNLLLTRDVDGLVMHMASRGVRVLEDDGNRVTVEAEAGEPWHPFVESMLAAGFAGLENLSLIPGTVGAAPVQNIGAYGVELKDVLCGLTAFDRLTGRLCDLSVTDCEFAYRDSLFKREAGRWIILRVRFRLHRGSALTLSYGPIRQWLAEHRIDQPTARDVSRAVCAIRRDKLPDPVVLGNAGSFFKNPVVDASRAAALQAQYPDLVAFPQADGQVKLAAGWLIERAGWKGYRDGEVGVHRLQALVLVNHGAATGSQVLALASRIQADVAARFGVQLEIEPIVL